jgi:hypothetical protein
MFLSKLHEINSFIWVIDETPLHMKHLLKNTINTTTSSRPPYVVNMLTFLGVFEIHIFHLWCVCSAAPSGMRSVASALLLLSNSLGAYGSSIFMALLDLATDRDGTGGWLGTNINRWVLPHLNW